MIDQKYPIGRFGLHIIYERGIGVKEEILELELRREGTRGKWWVSYKFEN